MIFCLACIVCVFVTNQSLYIRALPVFFTCIMFESKVMVGIQPGLLRAFHIMWYDVFITPLVWQHHITTNILSGGQVRILSIFPEWREGVLSFRNITRGDLSECKTLLNILKSSFLLKRVPF